MSPKPQPHSASGGYTPNDTVLPGIVLAVLLLGGLFIASCIIEGVILRCMVKKHRNHLLLGSHGRAEAESHPRPMGAGRAGRLRIVS
jgi:hypothetical protein